MFCNNSENLAGVCETQHHHLCNCLKFSAMASSSRNISVNDPDYSDNVREMLCESESDSDLVDDSDADPDFEVSDHDTDSEISPDEESDIVIDPLEDEDQNDIGNPSSGQKSTKYWYGRGKEKFKWSKQPPERSRTRTPAENIIPRMHLPGIIGPAKNLGNTCSEHQAWELIITNDMINEIVTCTNEKLRENRQKYKNLQKVELKDTDIIEMRALIGLLYYAGLFESNHGKGVNCVRKEKTEKHNLCVFHATGLTVWSAEQACVLCVTMTTKNTS